MGEFRHKVIVVTSFTHPPLVRAQALARDIFPTGKVVSEQMLSPINGFFTFFIGPDGSKLGWEESKKYNECRKKFLDRLRKESLSVDYAEICYGGSQSNRLAEVSRDNFRDEEENSV